MSQPREPTRWADPGSDSDPLMRRLISSARSGVGDPALAARIEEAVRAQATADGFGSAAAARSWWPWVGLAALCLAIGGATLRLRSATPETKDYTAAHTAESAAVGGTALRSRAAAPETGVDTADPADSLPAGRDETSRLSEPAQQRARTSDEQRSSAARLGDKGPAYAVPATKSAAHSGGVQHANALVGSPPAGRNNHPASQQVYTGHATDGCKSMRLRAMDAPTAAERECATDACESMRLRSADAPTAAERECATDASESMRSRAPDAPTAAERECATDGSESMRLRAADAPTAAERECATDGSESMRLRAMDAPTAAERERTNKGSQAPGASPATDASSSRTARREAAQDTVSPIRSSADTAATRATARVHDASRDARARERETTHDAAPPAAASGSARTGIVSPGLAPAQSAVPPELSLISAAQRALRHSPKKALALTEQHARAYPNGSFNEEREEIAISALFALDKHTAARTRAQTFLSEHPRALSAPRVRKLLDTSR